MDAQRAQQGQAQQAAHKAGGGGVQGGSDEDPRVKFEPDSPAAQAGGCAAAAAARCVVGQPGQVADCQAAVGGRAHADLRRGQGRGVVGVSGSNIAAGVQIKCGPMADTGWQQRCSVHWHCSEYTQPPWLRCCCARCACASYFQPLPVLQALQAGEQLSWVCRRRGWLAGPCQPALALTLPAAGAGAAQRMGTGRASEDGLAAQPAPEQSMHPRGMACGRNIVGCVSRLALLSHSKLPPQGSLLAGAALAVADRHSHWRLGLG